MYDRIPFIPQALFTSYATLSFCIYSKVFQLIHLYGIDIVPWYGVSHLHMRSSRNT